MTAKLPARTACRTMVDILALAHEQACEAALADVLDAELDAGRLPDMARLRTHFAPDAAALPVIAVRQVPLSAYEGLATSSLGEAHEERSDRRRSPDPGAQRAAAADHQGYLA